MVNESHMDTQNLKEIFHSQKTYFSDGHTTTLSFRIEALNTLRTLIEKYSDDIIEALSNDMGRPATESYTAEVAVLLKEITIAIKSLKNWSKPKRVSAPKFHWPVRTRLIPQPYGCVFIIGPWNYPFTLSLVPAISAIAAGNCVVVKPSELAYHSAQLMETFINQNFPSEFFKIVQGGADVSENLLEEKWDYVFFTGSRKIGRRVHSACAKQLIPCTLELGGKNPCIVDEKINISKTANRIVWGKFFNAGQTCVAPDFLYIHESVAHPLLNEIEFTLKKFYGDNPQNSPDYGRIINKHHFIRLKELIDSSAVCLGGQVDEDDLYIAPTLVEDVTWECRLMQNEIFGPILPILTYTHIEEVFRMLSTKPVPLACYLFSKQKPKQKLIQNRVRCGSLCLNNIMYQVQNRNLPFGGRGESGFGQYQGKAGFDTFSHLLPVIKKSFLLDSSMVYPPYKTSMKRLKKVLPWVN